MNKSQGVVKAPAAVVKMSEKKQAELSPCWVCGRQPRVENFSAITAGVSHFSRIYCDQQEGSRHTLKVVSGGYASAKDIWNRWANGGRKQDEEIAKLQHETVTTNEVNSRLQQRILTLETENANLEKGQEELWSRLRAAREALGGSGAA